jgi:hypothetical protein
MVFLALSAKPIGRLILPEVIRRFHAPEGVSKAPHVLNVLKGLPGAVAYAPWFFHRRYFQPMRLPGFFVRNAARTYGLSFHSEHFASAESRVWLGDDVDSRGMPRLTIDLRFSRRDAEALLRAHQLLDTWLRDSGHGFLRYRQPEDQTVAAILAVAEHGTHQLGTTRMGRDRRDGVVDENLKTFDVSNLYVVGSSIFPTSSQANPTFTAVALAVRLAEHLRLSG